MTRISLIFLLVCALASEAFAQALVPNQIPPSAFSGLSSGTKVPVTFTGVIDKETTVTHLFSVAAGSAALAASGVKAADLCSAAGCAGANLCSSVKVLATGALDIAAGLYCNSASQTVTAWCAGLASGCISGGTGRVSALYDQLNQTTVAVAASYAASPDFVLSAFNAKPALGCVSSRSSALTVTLTALNPPYSYGVSYERTGSAAYASAFSDSGSTFSMGGSATANTGWNQLFGNVDIEPPVTDGSSTSDFSHGHRMLSAWPTAAGTADVYVDGNAPVTGTSIAGAATITSFTICGYAATFINAFMTAAWTDPTQVSLAVGEAVTNLTTVPLP